jgi:hypothetical protein
MLRKEGFGGFSSNESNTAGYLDKGYLRLGRQSEKEQ